MSALAEVLAATKKILLVTDDLKRLSADSESLSNKVADHERRLIRLETIIEVTPRRSHRTLSGN
jgi:hypothetical protein